MKSRPRKLTLLNKSVRIMSDKNRRSKFFGAPVFYNRFGTTLTFFILTFLQMISNFQHLLVRNESAEEMRQLHCCPRHDNKLALKHFIKCIGRDIATLHPFQAEFHPGNRIKLGVNRPRAKCGNMYAASRSAELLVNRLRQP